VPHRTVDHPGDALVARWTHRGLVWPTTIRGSLAVVTVDRDDTATARATDGGSLPDGATVGGADPRGAAVGGSLPDGAAAGGLSDQSTPAPATLEPRRLQRLRVFNVVVGLIHLAQAAAMMALSNDLAIPVVTAYLDTDPVQALAPVETSELFALAIGPTVAFFLFLAAVDHLAVAAPGVRSWYERNLAQGINVARWVEYSVSASVMVVLIALFVGIRDGVALLALFGVNTSMILFGLLMERHQRPGRADWSAYWFGCLAGAVPWVAIVWYVAAGGEAPTFVYAITIIQFVLFCGFAANQALQYARVGPWRDYLFGETSYIVLSLAAKSLLAWIIFANVLRI